MRSDPVNASQTSSASHRERARSRRSLLRCAGQTGLAWGLSRFWPETSRADSTATLPAIGSRPSTEPIAESAKSTVVHIRADEVLSGRQVHPSLAGEMIEEALRTLTGKNKPADAWHAVLKSDDRIAIKFNRVGSEVLGTNAPLAVQLVASLGRAGFAPDRVMLIEAPPEVCRELKTKPAVGGWSGGEVNFSSGSEQLAAYLQEVTAIINVPLLKTHNLAGMTGCLKNLSHSLIRRPARYHRNGCAPYVGDILALPQIRSKLRLHIVNALRAAFDGGPEPRLAGTWAHAGVLVSRDPVAADSIGLTLLNEQRALAGLPQIGDALGRIPHLHAAAQRGLGTDDDDYINLVQPRPF